MDIGRDPGVAVNTAKAWLSILEATCRGIPGRWPATAVLAFGDGAVVVRTRNGTAGVQEVRVYGISTSG